MLSAILLNIFSGKNLVGDEPDTAEQLKVLGLRDIDYPMIIKSIPGTERIGNDWTSIIEGADKRLSVEQKRALDTLVGIVHIDVDSFDSLGMDLGSVCSKGNVYVTCINYMNK
ncbi:MAG: hypothetical protein V1888_01220 [archaeon]